MESSLPYILIRVGHDLEMHGMKGWRDVATPTTMLSLMKYVGSNFHNKQPGQIITVKTWGERKIKCMHLKDIIYLNP